MMATSAAAAPAVRRVPFHWILGPRSDAVFDIGSALAGWMYAAVIAVALSTLEDPLRDPLFTFSIGRVGCRSPFPCR